MLEVTSLKKTFGPKVVLDDISFAIGSGEIIGVVGPNGSGKTTLLNVLMGMLLPSYGGFKIANNIKVGMSVSRKGFFEDMTVMDNLLIYSKMGLFSSEGIRAALKKFSIDYENVMYSKLSAGMKQRVSLVLPFISHCDLIILDEPTNHLDVDSIIKLREEIMDLKNRKLSSFLFTSHILSDLEKVSDRIIFLKSGKIINNSATSSLLHHYGTLEEAYINIIQ